MFIAALFVHNSQVMEATQMSIGRWFDYEDVVHIQNGNLLSHKKERHYAFWGNMDGTRVSYTEWSKSESETYTIWYHTYGI